MSLGRAARIFKITRSFTSTTGTVVAARRTFLARAANRCSSPGPPRTTSISVPPRSVRGSDRYVDVAGGPRCAVDRYGLRAKEIPGLAKGVQRLSESNECVPEGFPDLLFQEASELSHETDNPTVGTCRRRHASSRLSTSRAPLLGVTLPSVQAFECASLLRGPSIPARDPNGGRGTPESDIAKRSRSECT